VVICLIEVQIVCICPADATASQTPSSLASIKSRLVLHFWYRLTQVVLENRLLNGCNSSSTVTFANTVFAVNIITIEL